MNINWAVISVEKGSPDRLTSVLNISQIEDKMIFEFYTLLFFLGKVLINVNLCEHTQSLFM